MTVIPEELDDYERARRAEINVAMGTGDEDKADRAMDAVNRAAR